MARRQLTIRIDAEGRDKGKVFVITELPASQAERWALRAVMALGAANAELPDGMELAGLAGLARGIGVTDGASLLEAFARTALTLFTRIPFEQAEELLSVMWACIQIIPDPGNPSVIRSLIEDDIEEVTTRLRLRSEIIKMHLGFSQAAGK